MHALYLIPLKVSISYWSINTQFTTMKNTDVKIDNTNHFEEKS